MANNLRDLRRRIKSVKNTQQITKAMKMVSASKLRRASERAVQARPYAERLFDVYRSVLQRVPEFDGPLYERREGKTLLVVVTADRGLCGSFNSSILKKAVQLIEDIGPEQVQVMPIGRKAEGFFKKSKYSFTTGYVDIFRNITAGTAEGISQSLTDTFVAEDTDISQVLLLFNKFKSVLVQEPTTQKLLPLSAEDGESTAASSGPEHLAEPNLEGILLNLGPKVITTQVYQALLESSASEHAARMTAMDAATNNAKDMISKLTLAMNKARQASITTELIEIVSGAAAL